MSKRKFNVGDKVKILDTGSKEEWIDRMQGTVGMSGVVQEYDKCEPSYLVETDGGVKWWYYADNLKLVSSTVSEITLDIQTCIDYLTSNGYKVTLEKL